MYWIIYAQRMTVLWSLFVGYAGIFGNVEVQMEKNMQHEVATVLVKHFIEMIVRVLVLDSVQTCGIGCLK